MSDRLALEGPKELRAFTVNGAVIVESEEERQRWVVIITTIHLMNDAPRHPSTSMDKTVCLVLRKRLNKTDCLKQIITNL